MATSIQVSVDLVDELKKRKISDSESYEDVIWDLLDDTMELTEETKKEIELARAQVRAGKFYTHEQVKKELHL